ncbi:MAG: hypothetical protein V1865_01970 [bacterium]
MGHIIVGLIIMAVGLFLIIKTESILRAFGQILWFERHLSTEGGSRLGYKLFGFVFLFIGFITTFGWLNDFLGWLLSPLTRYM